MADACSVHALAVTKLLFVILFDLCILCSKSESDSFSSSIQKGLGSVVSVLQETFVLFNDLFKINVIGPIFFTSN